MVYWLVLGLLLVLIYRYDINEDNVNRDFWYHVVLVSLILISGLRYRVGADTINYIYSFYHEIPSLGNLSQDTSGFEPLFVLMNSFVKTLGGRFYIVQILQAVFVNGLVLAYIKKHSQYLFSCIFLYCFYCYPFYNYEEMRASMSVALCLYGNDFFMEKKWLKGFLLYFVGIFFHYSTALLLFTPLLFFLRFNMFGYALLIFSFGLGYVIQQKFGDYLMLLQLSGEVAEKAENYANHDILFQQRINLFGVFSTKISLVLYMIGAFYYIKLKSLQGDAYILKFQPFVLIGSIFVLLSIPMPIAYRYIRFYNIYMLFFFVHLFMDVVKNNLQEMKSLAWVRALVIFLPFINAISHDYRDKYGEDYWSHYVYHYCRFYPYASVIEKSTDEDREFFYKNWDIGKVVNKDEY